MEICPTNDCVGLKHAPSSQGDHQCVVLLVHNMPKATQIVPRHQGTFQCANMGEDRAISYAPISLT